MMLGATGTALGEESVDHSSPQQPEAQRDFTPGGETTAIILNDLPPLSTRGINVLHQYGASRKINPSKFATCKCLLHRLPYPDRWGIPATTGDPLKLPRQAFDLKT